MLYENDAWAPTPSVLPRPSRSTCCVPMRTILRARRLRTDLSGARPVQPDASVTRAGAVLLSESYSSAWSARSGERSLDHVDAFGWANGFEQRSRGSIGFRFTAQWQRDLVALLQVLVWLALAAFWLRSTAVARACARATCAPARAAGDADGEATGPAASR